VNKTIFFLLKDAEMKLILKLVTFSSSSKINGYLHISSEGFSVLEKNALLCYQRAMLPIQSGVTALCR
jgi:filamentous hemagglutinin family protein